MGFYPFTASAGGLQAYQFQPETYGAKGNGVVCADVTTNGTLTVSSPTMGTSAQVGQYVMIHGANGTTGVPYLGTIAAIAGNSITLSAGNGTPSASVSNCPAVFGTDDTAAVAAAVAAAGTYAIANNFAAEVVFGAKIYMLGTGPTQVGNGSSTPTFNTQIPIPYPNPNNSTQKLMLSLVGAPVGAGNTQLWASTTPQVAGTALVSLASHSNTPDPTFGAQSVVGGPTGSAGFTAGGGLLGVANVKITVTNMSIWLPILTNIRAWDFGYLAQMRMEGCNAHIFAPTGVNGGVQPYLNALISSSVFKANISVGILAPVLGNNANVTADYCAVQGYECGFRVYDHFTAGLLQAVYCDVALNVDPLGASGNSHLVAIQNMDAEGYNGGLKGPSNPGMSHVNIWLSTECTGVVYDVSDPDNTMFGEVHFQDSSDTGRGITVSGGANLHIINDELGPGHMSSPPSVPLTTVAAALVFRDAWVAVHTGAGVTVSAITIDGTATGQTMVASSTAVVRVPSGKTIALTYAGGTPTWDWWLD